MKPAAVADHLKMHLTNYMVAGKKCRFFPNNAFLKLCAGIPNFSLKGCRPFHYAMHTVS